MHVGMRLQSAARSSNTKKISKNKTQKHKQKNKTHKNTRQKNVYNENRPGKKLPEMCVNMHS